MALAADHFAGRADELGVLDQLLDELDDGRAGAVELVGEPGIGKTRLLRELAARADRRSHLVLTGSASELERDLPFSVFVDALDEYLEGLQSVRLGALEDDVRTELAHVFPSLSTLASGRRAALQHERYRSHRAVRELLERLAARGPLVLQLDDFHWADSASMELLGALLRRPPDAPVLIALAARPRQLPDRLSAALERAIREGTLTRIALGELSAEEAHELLGSGIDGRTAAALYEESGGNPFYLEQLGRSRDGARGDAADAPELSFGTGVPAAVSAALREELSLLSPPARLVLEGAAVAGDPFEPDLAAAAAATSEAAAMDAVDELLALDLVRTTEVPRRFRFRHPLVRRAVYEASAGGWRLGAHERCAEALAARGAPAAARAHHVQRSAREGDAAAVAVLREAGEGAARLAPASAARWLGDALRLLPPSAPAQERIDLLVARSGALTAAGHYAESHDALLEALTLVPEEAHEQRARLARACAASESLLGRHERAGARLASAIEELPDQGSPEAVALMNELCVNLVWRARYDEMHAWAVQSVEAAGRLGDAPLTAAALAKLALAESMIGSPKRAEAARAEAAAIVDSLPDEKLAAHVDAAARLSGTELYLGRYAEGDVHASRALSLARATGRGELFLVLVQTLGALWRLRGKLAEAGELLDGGIEASRLLGNAHALVWSLCGRSAAAIHAGDLDLALATAQEAVELSDGLDEGFHSAEAAVDLARALLELGRPEGTVELLLESAGGDELLLIAGGPRAHALELLAHCCLALGRRDEARHAAAAAGAWAAVVQLPIAVCWAERAAAAVALEEGEAADSANRALAAAAAADEAGAPIESALSRALAGRALARAGEADRAAAELQRAVQVFESCGAPRYRDAAERELRQLGHHIHRRTRPGKAGASRLESLTERELQVARLVVDRKTNAEIAAELFLSTKTVETHLRNIFRKLGVSSRVAVARAVERVD
jgi:DNA-binding NarL/FixJ family response regulator/tetratricopeptide (TPR) repeat protein